MGAEKKHRMLRFLLKSLLTVIIVVLLAAVLGYFLLLPAFVRAIAEKQAQNYVNGSVTIQTVDIDLWGTSRVGKITVKDEQKKTWLYVDSVDIAIENIMSFAPQVKRIDINNPIFSAHNASGDKLPFKTPPPAKDSKFEIPPEKMPEIFLNNASIEIPLEKLNSKEIIDNISASVKFKPDGSGIGFSVAKTGSESNISTINGEINTETLQADVLVSIKHDLKEDQFASLIKTKDVPEVTDATGLIFGDLRITGKLDDPQTLEVLGDMNARDIILSSGRNKINSDMDVSITFSGRKAHVSSASFIADAVEFFSGPVDISYDQPNSKIDLNFTGCKINFPPAPYGQYWTKKLKDNSASGYIDLQGSASIVTGEKIKINESVSGKAWFERIVLQLENPLLIQRATAEDFKSVNGKFNCDKVYAGTCGGTINGKISHDRAQELSTGVFDFESLDVARLMKAINKDNRLTRGSARGNISFEMRELSKEKLNMDVTLAVDNSDIETNPIAAEVFKITQINPLRIGGLNDIYTELKLDYPILTINKARVANDLAAIDAEPGGTVNIDEQHIDMYVVVGNFNILGTILPSSTGELAKKLTRIGIRGKLSDPPAKLLHKEPLSDISTAMADFFRASMQSPQTISRDILDIINDPSAILKKVPTSLPEDLLKLPQLPQIRKPADNKSDN